MRRASDLKRWSAIVVALLALGLLPTWAMYGQATDSAKTWGSFRRPARPAAAPTPAATPGRVGPAAVAGPFLPVLLMSTRVMPIVFTGGLTSDCQSAAGMSFTYGIKYLCADVIVDGAQGQTYRFSWAIDGKLQSSLGNSGTISSQLVDIPDGICYGTGGACGDAIPRGTYQVSFFLNNIQYQTATAVIK